MSLREICLVAVMTMATTSDVFAQGAVQAVRQRVEGVDTAEGEFREAPPIEALPGGVSAERYASEGLVEAIYVTPTAAAAVVLRPAQILAAPLAEMLPTEVATAAGLAYLGIDPASVDEVVAFVDVSNLMMPAYGATVRFNQPFRGSAIPAHARPHGQLGELAGRKYVQSSHPLWPSFYGTDKTTLIVAPDATLRQLVESAGGSTGGILVERLRVVPREYDLYLAVDRANSAPVLQMAAGMAPAEVPAANQLLEVTNLIAAAELTLNISNAGPTSLVLHCTDESAAQRLEAMLLELEELQADMPGSIGPEPVDPIAEAMAQYRARMSQSFGRRRDGDKLIVFHVDGQDPAKQQFVSSLVVLGLAMVSPILEQAQNMGEQAQEAMLDEGSEAPASESFSPEFREFPREQPPGAEDAPQ